MLVTAGLCTFAQLNFIISINPSGCVKSTNLGVIAGLEGFTIGPINIGERSVNDIAL
jgi:ABC-type sugar transport system ATPase subunit